MSRRWNTLLLSLTFAVCAEAALAQPTPAQQDAVRSNCRSDFMSKCSGVPRGGKEALECLQRNVASLSPACKSAVSATISIPAPAEAKPPQPAPAPKAVTAPQPPQAAPTGPAPTAAPRAITPAPPPPATASRPAVPKPQQTAKPAQAPTATAPPPAEPVVPMAKIDALPVRLAVIRSCRSDQDAVCSSVRAGGGRLIACLAANSRALSPPCKTALEKALR